MKFRATKNAAACRKLLQNSRQCKNCPYLELARRGHRARGTQANSTPDTVSILPSALISCTRRMALSADSDGMHCWKSQLLRPGAANSKNWSLQALALQYRHNEHLVWPDEALQLPVIRNVQPLKSLLQRRDFFLHFCTPVEDRTITVYAYYVLMQGALTPGTSNRQITVASVGGIQRRA